MKRFLYLALSLILFVACTPTTETAVTTPPPTSEPETAVLPENTAPPPIIITESPRVEPLTAVPSETSEAPNATATTPPEPTAEAVSEPVVVSSRTEEGAFFLGDPNAPITLIDYSDFL